MSLKIIIVMMVFRMRIDDYSAQIERQVKFERDAIRQGVRNYTDAADLEKKSYASASVYGCSSIQSALPAITKRLETTQCHHERQSWCYIQGDQAVPRN